MEKTLQTHITSVYSSQLFLSLVFEPHLLAMPESMLLTIWALIGAFFVGRQPPASKNVSTLPSSQALAVDSITTWVIIHHSVSV